MDTLLDPSVSSYSWPTDLIDAVGFGLDELGFLAWRIEMVDGREQNTYRAIDVLSGSIEKKGSKYQLTALPGQTLETVWLTVSRWGDEASEPVVTELGGSYFPAGRAFDVILVGIEDPGLYRIEVSADIYVDDEENGGSMSLALFMRHDEIRSDAP